FPLPQVPDHSDGTPGQRRRPRQVPAVRLPRSSPGADCAPPACRPPAPGGGDGRPADPGRGGRGSCDDHHQEQDTTPCERRPSSIRGRVGAARGGHPPPAAERRPPRVALLLPLGPGAGPALLPPPLGTGPV